MNKKRWFSVFCMIILILSLIGCGSEKEQIEHEPVELDISQMQSICELATLECYYHNTAKLDSEKQVLFWNTSKKLWIEYSGVVKLGVNLDKLEMEVEDNIVTLTLPDAKVLDCKVDETSLSDEAFYSETHGLGSGKVGAEEQTKAFRAAQEGMLETVKKDESLLRQAKERAQTLLEKYVDNVGDALGVEYEVCWKTASDEFVNNEQATE